ncbi:MAG: hypothetical protein A3K83_00185 [Omnitrophica WOR_2 bacterium RBG_13_44_8b]|nr:MAG: hypothetical protein A3K83_00185 [Omnitrophica WOR_2 bacterium RBG_13_44_8b]
MTYARKERILAWHKPSKSFIWFGRSAKMIFETRLISKIRLATRSVAGKPLAKKGFFKKERLEPSFER